MAVVSELLKPVFPSLLVSRKDLGAQTGQEEGSHGVPRLPHIRATSPRPSTVPTGNDTSREAVAGTTRAVSQGGKYDREQLSKKIKKAEAMQREWEAIKQSERDRKKLMLDQRVQIQRQLILKTDLLSKQLWTAAEEKKLREVEERRKSRHNMTRALRDHMRKIEEHKRKIAEKLGDLEGHSNVTSDVAPNACINTDKLQSPDNDCTLECDQRPSQETDEPPEGPETSITIEEVWDGLRAKSVKKLETITTHSNMLKKKISSPSARLCLEIYERPTAHSSATGRPVPFSELVGDSSDVKEKHSGLPASLLAASIRMNEQKAQYMMRKKQYPTSSQGGGDPGWYGLGPSLHGTSNNDATNMASERYAEVKARHDGLGTGINDLTYTGGIDEKDSHAAEIKGTIECHTANHSGPSMFITEPPTVDSKTRQSGWCPLSHLALAEYTTVSELPIHGPGDKSHGKYKMWRPY